MKLKITVHGVAYEVDVEVLDAGESAPGIIERPTLPPQQFIPHQGVSVAKRGSLKKPSPPLAQAVPSAGDAQIQSPIAGTIMELQCAVGDSLEAGQLVLILEAMKMKTKIGSPSAGKVKAILVSVGDSVREGQVLVELA